MRDRYIVGFTGHRDRTCNPKVLDWVAKEYPDALWVHGGAQGFDTQVEEYAEVHEVRSVILRPDYARFGSHAAPLRRNDDIVALADVMVACHDGRKTGGTWYTMLKAEAEDVPLVAFPPQDDRGLR